MIEQPASRAPLGERIRLGASIAAVGALVLFCLQNLQDAEVNFLWFDWSLPVVVVIVLSAVAGAIAAASLSTIRTRRRRAREAIQVGKR
jgi:uncharacterized integral membrane protein